MQMPAFYAGYAIYTIKIKALHRQAVCAPFMLPMHARTKCLERQRRQLCSQRGIHTAQRHIHRGAGGGAAAYL